MNPASLLRSPERFLHAACELSAATEMTARGVAALSSAYFSSTQPAEIHGPDGARILFVHGMLGNHSWSAPLARALEALGYTTQSLDYRTVGVTLDQAAESVAAAIAIAVPTGQKVHVVAHSLGGVVIRAVAAHYGLADRFASVTTLATPHNGTPLAFRAAMALPGIGKLVRDLHPGSQALIRLAAAECGTPDCTWTALYSPDDELVPAQCGSLQSDALQAENIAVDGLGHFTITTHQIVHELVCTRIASCDQYENTPLAA